MGQIRNILARLSPKQRIVILATALALGFGLYSFAHWRKEAGFKPLYTGLAPEDSAAVVQKLKESGAEYRLSETGDAISVPADRLAELRLEMAGAGLPKTGRMGFEIFDKNNLGATEFVEHVNFRRALEGELERSVGAISAVETARIHITFPKESVFLESREPAKASVLVKLKAGARLLPRNVTAITRLVASAVEGLSPDAVSVLDMQGNLLSRPTASTPAEAESEAALDYRQKLERDLLQKINSTLDPLLGREHYRAGVTVECDFTSGEQTEEVLDPTRSVMVQSQKTEDVTGSGGQSGGVPGTASNLPHPPVRASSTPSSTSRRTENVTYASTRTTRTTKIPQGNVKRVSIALLLDQSVRWEGAGTTARRVLTPPSPETMKSVRDIVAAVAGTIETRGDQVTVETLPFETTLNVPAPEAPAPPPAAAPSSLQFKWTDWRQKPMLIGMGAGAALVLLGAVAFFVLRARKKKVKASIEAAKALAAASPAAAGAIESANLAEELQAKLAERDAEQEKADLLALASIKVPPVRTKKTEVLAKQLRQSTKKDPSSAAHVLQEWIHDRN